MGFVYTISSSTPRKQMPNQSSSQEWVLLHRHLFSYLTHLIYVLLHLYVLLVLSLPLYVWY